MSQENRFLTYQWKNHEREPKKDDLGGFGCAVLDCNWVESDATDWWKAREVVVDSSIKIQSRQRRKARATPATKLANYVVTQRRQDFIRISKMQFDALVERLSVLEEKLGVSADKDQTSEAAVPKQVVASVMAMSRELFGQDVQLAHEDEGFDGGKRSRLSIKAAVSSEVDSEQTSHVVSEWYRRLGEIAPTLLPGSIGLDLDFQ